MAKKKRQKYVRLVRTKNNGWVFKTQLGFVIGTFLASIVFMSINMTGNVVADTIGQGFSLVGAFLFVFAIVQAFILIASRKR